MGRLRTASSSTAAGPAALAAVPTLATSIPTIPTIDASIPTIPALAASIPANDHL